MRNTRQRTIIIEELMGLRDHPSADELYAKVRRRIPRISLGTVYRNLDNLAKQDIIRRLEFGGSVKRFDGDTSSHEHVRCVVCGRIDDLHGETGLTEHDRALLRGTGYRLLERRVDFLGICPACIERKKRG